jgi:hypothetical protein
VNQRSGVCAGQSNGNLTTRLTKGFGEKRKNSGGRNKGREPLRAERSTWFLGTEEMDQDKSAAGITVRVLPFWEGADSGIHSVRSNQRNEFRFAGNQWLPFGHANGMSSVLPETNGIEFGTRFRIDLPI